MIGRNATLSSDFVKRDIPTYFIQQEFFRPAFLVPGQGTSRRMFDKVYAERTCSQYACWPLAGVSRKRVDLENSGSESPGIIAPTK